MKSFRGFLAEGHTYTPLYHGTSFSNVAKILQKGHLEPSSNGRVSLTRDQKVARGSYGEGEAYFKFNKEALRSNKQIKPTDWYMGGSVEDEHLSHFREPSMRRVDAEESVKGPVDLKHATELVIHKKHWDQMHGPKTKFEHDIEHHIKSLSGEEKNLTKDLYRGLYYKDRVKDAKGFKKLLAKHPHIKVNVKDY